MTTVLAMSTDVLAMSTERVIGLVLVSVFGPIILFGVLVAVVLGWRVWRAYGVLRPNREPRVPRRQRQRNTEIRNDDDTDRFNTNTWESSPR